MPACINAHDAGLNFLVPVAYRLIFLLSPKCSKAFFLEDVLLQTQYLGQAGVANTSGTALAQFEALLRGQDGVDGQGDSDSFQCVLCGRGGFRYVYVCVDSRESRETVSYGMTPQ